MRVLTCDPNAEIFGANLQVFVDHIQADETRPIFEKHQLIDLEGQKWYPVIWWLNALNELGGTGNASANMIAIGIQITSVLEFPPGLTLEAILMGWDDIYYSVHRGGDIGHVTTEAVTPTHYKITLTDIYPDDLSYGIAYGFARRFCPAGKTFKVYYEPNVPRRDDGGADVTLINVTWE